MRIAYNTFRLVHTLHVLVGDVVFSRKRQPLGDLLAAGFVCTFQNYASECACRYDRKRRAALFIAGLTERTFAHISKEEIVTLLDARILNCG